MPFSLLASTPQQRRRTTRGGFELEEERVNRTGSLTAVPRQELLADYRADLLISRQRTTMSPKPSRSAYAPLPRQSTDSGSSSTDSLSFPTGPSSQTPTRTPPSATALHVDLLFRRWTSEIAERIRRKKREGKTKKQKKKAGAVEERDRNKPVEIMASAFEVWEGAGKGKGRERVVRTLDHGELMSKEAFDG